VTRHNIHVYTTACINLTDLLRGFSNIDIDKIVSVVGITMHELNQASLVILVKMNYKVELVNKYDEYCKTYGKSPFDRRAFVDSLKI
jgi:hypothetical protein